MRRIAQLATLALLTGLLACSGGGSDPDDPDGVGGSDSDIGATIDDGSGSGGQGDGGGLKDGAAGLDAGGPGAGDAGSGGGGKDAGAGGSKDAGSAADGGSGAGQDGNGGGPAGDAGATDGAGGGSDDAGAGGDTGGGSQTDGGSGGGQTDAGSGGGQACSFDAAKGPTGQECPPGMGCVVGVGVCSGQVSGVCLKPSDFCPAVVTPVCDCAGQTWNNLCEAQKAGVVVKQGGICPVVGPPCGGQANVPCPGGQFCEPDSCGLDAAGTCVAGPAPGDCPAGGAPQCGCDGNTWPSECARMKAGVGLKYAGACLPDPNAQGCKLGPVKPILCPADFYCLIGDKGACEGLGTCQPLPLACTKELKPVCGCDQNTYDNACLATKAGWNVKSADPCPK